jgi:hypothetical protein
MLVFLNIILVEIYDTLEIYGRIRDKNKTTLSEGYHHEIDDTLTCTEEDSTKYRSIVGCCIWVIVSWRFDISYTTSAMSRFNMSPREGFQEKASKRIPDYLKTFLKASIIVDIAYPNQHTYYIKDHLNLTS